MMVRKIRGRSRGRAICIGLVLTAALSGCDRAVEFGRSVSGMNKNDPDPATAPFTANLDQAQSGAYPNLASVPPPPTVATTAAERLKLTETLTKERTSAEAKDAGGNSGMPASGPVPPPPPVPESIAAPELAGLPPPEKPATPIPPLRKMDEPPAPQPQESSLQIPEIANKPGVERSRAAPPPGQPSAMPRPSASETPETSPRAMAPQPAPASAELPPPPRIGGPPPKLPPTATTVASLDIPPSAIALDNAEQARLTEAVARYQAKPSTVRVVAYAAPGVGSAEQLNAFRLALDRAQDVAKQLSAAGIPVKQIQTEAAPATPAAPPGRIEVQLLQ
ncbi:MAG: hypothetical protein JO032_07560 [Alphaproteobacteria bacterium]|nr:hypothetical protein [Alphaproteobacteria bacterium]